MAFPFRVDLDYIVDWWRILPFLLWGRGCLLPSGRMRCLFRIIPPQYSVMAREVTLASERLIPGRPEISHEDWLARTRIASTRNQL